MPHTILLTGAGGFVGRHLLPALRHRFPDSSVLAPDIDVTDSAATADAVATARPDALIHLAAIAAPSAATDDPDHAWHVNLHGTLAVARAIRAGAPGCTLVFASSADAYGGSFRTGAQVDERAPLAPLSTYSATKAAADLALGAMAAADGLRTVRIRPFNHTGPGQSAAYVVPAFARQIARIAAGLQAPVIDVGNLAPARDFLDVRDVCAAYCEAVARAGSLAPDTVINLASGQARTIASVLDDLLRLSGVAAEIRPDPARVRPTEITCAVGDPALAHRLLGWQPTIPFEQTLRDVLEDWRGRHSP